MDGNTKVTFGYDVLADLETFLIGNFSECFWRIDSSDEQLHIWKTGLGFSAAIMGFLAEYFQDVFRISIMADNESEKMKNYVIIAM